MTKIIFKEKSWADLESAVNEFVPSGDSSFMIVSLIKERKLLMVRESMASTAIIFHVNVEDYGLVVEYDEENSGSSAFEALYWLESLAHIMCA